jgi:hypothetical protein
MSPSAGLAPATAPARGSFDVAGGAIFRRGTRNTPRPADGDNLAARSGPCGAEEASMKKAIGIAAFLALASAATAAGDPPEFDGPVRVSLRWIIDGRASPVHSPGGPLAGRFHAESGAWSLGAPPGEEIGDSDAPWESGTYAARHGVHRLALDSADEVRQRDFLLDWAQRGSGLVLTRTGFAFDGRFVRRGRRGVARLTLAPTYVDASGEHTVTLRYRMDQRSRAQR